MSFHTLVLRNELQRRQEKNSRYSMRSFASFLAIDCAALSRILNGKASLSMPVAASVLKKLELTPEDRFRFVESVFYEKTRNELKKLAQQAQLGELDLELRVRPVEAQSESAKS